METTRLPSLPSLTIRIDLDPEGRIGPGKVRLLEAVERCGSISAAGRMLNISYKRAWNLLDEVARTCNHDVIVGYAGGAEGGGAQLTPFGLALVARYRRIERKIIEATKDELWALRKDIGTG
jgi:molybdate transport system regulatory protein